MTLVWRGAPNDMIQTALQKHWSNLRCDDDSHNKKQTFRVICCPFQECVKKRVFFIWGGPILGRQFLHHFCCWEVRKPSYLNRVDIDPDVDVIGQKKKDDMTWLPEWGLTQVVETWMLNPIYDPWDGIDFSLKLLKKMALQRERNLSSNNQFSGAVSFWVP